MRRCASSSYRPLVVCAARKTALEPLLYGSLRRQIAVAQLCVASDLVPERTPVEITFYFLGVSCAEEIVLSSSDQRHV